MELTDASQDKLIYKSTLKSSSPLIGYYTHSDAFQIYEYNNMKSDEEYFYINIEYNCKHLLTTDDDASYIGGECEGGIAGDRRHLNLLKEIVALISIATGEKLEIVFDKDESLFPPAQEKINEFSDLSAMRPMRECGYHASRGMRSNCDFVSIQPEARLFFENYFSLKPDEREVYNASTFLYQMGENLTLHASMAVIAYVSSIENLMNFDKKRRGQENEKCPTCNQVRYKIASSFKSFMKKYSKFGGGNSNKVIDRIYSMRSNISHAGLILKMDRTLTLFQAKEWMELADIGARVRVALFNYLVNFNR